MSNGWIPTRKLFKQFHPEGTEDIEDWRKRFVDCLDPTEYSAAIELVGSWSNWLTFKKQWPHFTNNILPEWLEEVDIKMRSKAVREVVLDAGSDSKSATSSAKWLAEGRYIQKQAGRPKKSDILREAKIAAGIHEEVEDDLERLANIVDFKSK